MIGKKMFKNLFVFDRSFFKVVIFGVLFAAAPAAITVAFFVIISCYRAVGTPYRKLFRLFWVL